MTDPLHKMPGYKRAPVTLVLHIYETIQDDPEDDGSFYIEENHCLDNYIVAMAETIRRHEHPTRPEVALCTTCARGEAFLGHIPIAEIRKLRAPDNVNENATDHEADTDADPWAKP